MRIKIFIFCFMIVFGLLLNGCHGGGLFSSPEKTSRQFLESVNNNKPDKALNYICESMVIPGISEKIFENLRYEEISNDGFVAVVHVKGEIRLKDEDLGAIKKNLDFKFELQFTEDNWCIKRDSLMNMLESIVDLSY